MSVSALVEDRRDGDLGAARPVLQGAFEVLASLRLLGSARVSELQLASGLSRTTVRRLLIHLENVGAVESSTGRWRLGPVLLELGAGEPASRHLRAVARRPLMDLAATAGELVALVLESAGERLVIDVLPGTRPLAFEPEPGMVLKYPRLAPARAYHQARRGDLRTVLDAGAFDWRISSAAAPMRVSPQDLAVMADHPRWHGRPRLPRRGDPPNRRANRFPAAASHPKDHTCPEQPHA